MKRSIKRSTGELTRHEAKRFALRAAAVFTVCGLLTGCAAQHGFARTALESRSHDSVRVSIGTNMADSSSTGGICFFHEEEYAKLRALQWDGYEDMSIFDYQNAVWSLTDTWEYHDLLERLSKDDAFYEGRDDDETAAFFFYVLEPLSGERWRTRGFGGCAVSGGHNEHPLYVDNALLEFDITLTILDEKELTVGEYNAARIGMTDGMRDVLWGKTDLQLQDEALMRQIIDAEVEQLTEQWGSGNLEIAVAYVYMPLSAYEASDEARNGNQQSGGQDGSDGKFDGQSGNPDGQWEERREYPNGTPEDYRSLFTLKTPDYQEKRLADFNRAVLAWMEEDYERAGRINCDIGWNDFAVPLTEEERFFVMLSVNLSGMENGMEIQSRYTGREKDPCVNQYLPDKVSEECGHSAWCSLFYQFSYHIVDKETITVGERDRIVNGMMAAIREFWETEDLESLLYFDEAQVVEILQALADAYSTRQLTIHIDECGVDFERMDERCIMEEREPFSQDGSAAYEKFLSYKTDGYLSLSVAEFNALIAPTRDAFGEALEAYAGATISKEDENYDFFDVTLRASLSELYGEVFEEAAYFSVVLSRKERPYVSPIDGYVFYEFLFYANVDIEYRVTSPETLTVAERDEALRSCREELQSYVEGLSEEQILYGNIRAALTRKAAELERRYADDGMELSIGIGHIDMVV